MKLFHLNRASGWRIIIVLMHKNETELKNDFEKDVFKLYVNAAFGKFLEKVRNRLELELIKKHKMKKNIKRQTKLTFNGIHKSYENYDSYTFKQNQVVMDKAIYVGFLFWN